jgi:hypothetical protein
MKKIILATLVMTMTATVHAQSAFEGFYGQIATGYEKNSVSNTDINVALSNGTNFSYVGADKPSDSGMPLVVGFGYNTLINPKFLLGVGADYSFVSPKTNVVTGTRANGATSSDYYEISNRYTIFVAPGYVLDRDKLLYAKAGYTSQKIEMFASPSGLSEGSDSMSGYVLGLGYKQIINKGLYGS